MANLSAEAQDAVNALKSLPEAEQKVVVKEANPGLLPSSDPAKVSLWQSLIRGLIAVVIVGLVVAAALAWLAPNGSATSSVISGIIALATGAVGGVIGLFAKSP